MVHALVGDAPDRLFLVGDGQQKVYPGGFKLFDAGISVADLKWALLACVAGLADDPFGAGHDHMSLYRLITCPCTGLGRHERTRSSHQRLALAYFRWAPRR
jgi:hypothetical protein